MKTAARVLIGIVGIVAVVAGVRQMVSGVRQMTGNPVKQPQEAGERVSIADHGCSLRVPRGWTEKKTPQGGVMFVAPTASGYVANLIAMSEESGGTLREYADANIEGVKTAMPDAKFASDSPFVMDSGAPSFKVTFANKVKELDIVQAMYFFDGPPGRKIVITTTASAEHGAELQPLFDTCIKTLTVPAT